MNSTLSAYIIMVHVRNMADNTVRWSIVNLRARTDTLKSK